MAEEEEGMNEDLDSSDELINRELADELFSDSNAPDLLEIQLELWEGVRRDLLPDLERIAGLVGAQDAGEIKRLTHRVAGYSGSAGLNRCCRILRKMEREGMGGEDAARMVGEARKAAEEGMRLMEQWYPHLACGAGPPPG